MINMAAWIPKIVRATRSQNVSPVIYAVQDCKYSSEVRVIKNPTTAKLKRGTGGRSSFNGIVCTVFGCSSFIGQPLSIHLGRSGTQLILPHRCDFYHIRELKVGADLGQVFFHPFDLKDEESLIRVMKYSNVVINLLGACYETSNFGFEDVHVHGARKIAKLAKQLNIERLIHVSCLNAQENPTPIMLENGSKILRTKWLGEQAVKEEFPEATIIRPSMVYGRQDKFISHYMNPGRQTFRNIALWDKGESTEKQPVYIHDLVAGMDVIVKNHDTAGKTYQFIGPNRYKLNDLVMWLFDVSMNVLPPEVRPKVIDMRYSLVSWMKIFAWETIYPIHPRLDFLWEVLELHHTTDKIDPTLPTLEDLGIKLTNMETRLEWELMPYTYGSKLLSDLQKIVPPEVKSDTK